jgi:hypothetical protein
MSFNINTLILLAGKIKDDLNVAFRVHTVSNDEKLDYIQKTINEFTKHEKMEIIEILKTMGIKFILCKTKYNDISYDTSLNDELLDFLYKYVKEKMTSEMQYVLQFLEVNNLTP